MDKELLGELLIRSLAKYNFKNYGKKLFYLDLKDSIIILEQLTYMSCAELYINFIIKECHPEICKITKKILKDEMLIDNFSTMKLFYDKGHMFDFYEIYDYEFQNKIDEIYKKYIKPFEKNCIDGVANLVEIMSKDKYGTPYKLYKDAAIKIGHAEWAAIRDHAWIQSDVDILSRKYKIDWYFVYEHTANYIMENIVKKAPKELEGKELTKWCNQRCREIFVTKRKRRDLGYCSMILPFVDGEPLKFDGFTRIYNKEVQFYIDEDKNEYYRCTIIDDSTIDKKYELIKIEG